MDDLENLEHDMQVDEKMWSNRQTDMNSIMDAWWNNLVAEEEEHEKERAR